MYDGLYDDIDYDLRMAVHTRKDCNESIYRMIERHMMCFYKTPRKETVDQYRTVLLKLSKDLEKRGIPFTPEQIDEKTIILIRNEIWEGQAVSTKKWKMHILDRLLRFYGNYVVSNMRLDWGQDTRPNVDWLSPEEMKVLRDLPMSPLERIVINLELFCGLRNVEVVRLRMKDVRIGEGYLEVRGKGRGGGKWRSVPMGYGTEEAVEQWKKERNRIISEYRKFHPEDTIPESFLIWGRYEGQKMVINGYSERGHSLDRAVIIPIRESVGFKFSNHTLRRTFGRESFHAGVKIATISKILGHESIDMTLKYLGLNMDDMKAGMDKAKDHFGNL